MFILIPVRVSRCAQLVNDITEGILIMKVAISLENKSQQLVAKRRKDLLSRANVH